MENRIRILAALDGSDQSLAGVRYVSRVVSSERAEVTLLHVLPGLPDAYRDMERFPAMARQMKAVQAWAGGQQKMMETFMARAARLLMDAGFPPDRVLPLVRERETGIARDLAKTARQGYDCVVAGRTGSSRIRDLVMGSVAAKLAESLSDVPVWIVDGNPEPGRVVVGVDGSPGGRRAVAHAGRMLSGTDAEVLLIHVRRAMPAGFGDLMRDAGPETSPGARLEEPGLWLQELSDMLAAAGLPPDRVRAEVVSEVASRAAALVDRALMEGAGTLVVGRRGLSMVEEFPMGRVCRKVMQMARNQAVWIVG